MFCKYTPSRRPSTCCSLQVPGCPSTDISSWTLREKLCSSAGLGHPEPKTGQGGDKKWQDGLASVKGMVWAWNPQIFEDRAPPEICGVRALTPLMRREDGWTMFLGWAVAILTVPCWLWDVVTLQGSPWVPCFQDNFGDTALHMAARSNSLAVVTELLEPPGVATTRSWMRIVGDMGILLAMATNKRWATRVEIHPSCIQLLGSRILGFQRSPSQSQMTKAWRRPVAQQCLWQDALCRGRVPQCGAWDL